MIFVNHYDVRRCVLIFSEFMIFFYILKCNGKINTHTFARNKYVEMYDKIQIEFNMKYLERNSYAKRYFSMIL